MEEPHSSSPRDTPEQNSAPELTGEPEHLVRGSRSIGIDRPLRERVMSQIHERGSLMLELSRHWEEFEKEIDLKELALSKKILELEKKEERLKLVEEREKKIDLLEVSINEKEEESDLKQVMVTDVMRLVLELENEQVGTQLKGKEKLLGLVHDSLVKKHGELVKELQGRKKEIRLLSKSTDEKAREFDMKQSAETERMNKEAEMMVISHKQLEAREKELRLLNEMIHEKSIELEKKEEGFQLKQEAEAREIQVKEKKLGERNKFMELQEKKLGEMEKELELKQREFEERLVQAETRKRFRQRELRSSLLGEKGRDNAYLLRPRKMHKTIREYKHDGQTSCDSESEDTSEAIVCVDEADMDLEPFNCPDPDFNDFSNTMSSFAVGQVWALYDPLDDMPRYYARIKSVLKKQPSLRVTWLESIQTTENQKPIPIACGGFKYGNSETKGLLMFSHQMDHIGHSKNVLINPRKGETWALFRDWNKTWTSHREQHKPPYKYDLVEVITEFDSDQGIGVAYLKRVEGFTAVYEHGAQRGVIKAMISCDKMLSFSHRVPSYKLIGDEEEGIPNGWFELDPAAIPQACLNDYALVLV